MKTRTFIAAALAVHARTIATTRQLIFHRAWLWTGFLAFAMIALGPQPAQAAVTEAWKKFFEGPQAPFSWEPDNVLVMTNGELALSSGPVRDPSGKLVARFNSVWRQEAPGVWRIILDMGNDACDCPKQ